MEPRTPRSDPVTTAGRVGAVRPDVFGEGPAVIGHRGLGCGVVAGHQQNTLSSFAAAVRSGHDGWRPTSGVWATTSRGWPMTPPIRTAPGLTNSRGRRPTVAARCVWALCWTGFLASW